MPRAYEICTSVLFGARKNGEQTNCGLMISLRATLATETWRRVCHDGCMHRYNLLESSYMYLIAIRGLVTGGLMMMGWRPNRRLIFQHGEKDRM